MNMKMKRLFGILLSLMMVLGLLPGMMFSAYAATSYDLWVSGVQVTSENLTIDSTDDAGIKGGSATFDPATNTLTLNNFTYTGPGYNDYGEGGGIDCRMSNLTIVLKGSNSIVKKDDNGIGRSHGIYFNGGTLTMKGDGSLNISFDTNRSGWKSNGIFCEPGAFVMESGTVVSNAGTGQESAGIYTDDGITFNGGSFTGNGYTTTAYESRGIYSHGTITINGGTVTGTTPLDNQYDAYGFDTGSVIINGGTVTAIGKNAFSSTWAIKPGAGVALSIMAGDSKDTARTVQTIPSDAKYAQITKAVTKYNLWVGGLQVTEDNAANITGGDTVTASYDAANNTLTLNGYSFSGTGYADQGGYSGAIYAGEGLDLNLVLSGANSVENNSTSSMRCGIYAGGALTISGNGTLKAGAKDRGISCRGKLTIRSGSVTAKNNGYSGHGMFVDGDVEISGGTVSVEGASNGICSQGGSVTISGGEVTAKSDDGEGVFAQRQIKITGGKVTAETKSRIGMSSSNVTIESGEIIAIGNEKGIGGTVVNAIPGTGWTDRDGTAGKAGIPVSTSGQSLDYKKVQFPGESLPPAEVTEAPTAKTLTYTSSAQELVTAAPTSVPKTGDGANLVLWIGLILLGFLGIIAFAGVAGRKHRNR